MRVVVSYERYALPQASGQCTSVRDGGCVPKSTVARMEAGALPATVARWFDTVTALGLELTVAPGRPEDALVAPPPHRDGAGRQFPAHVIARRLSMPPTWWFVRNGGWGTKVAEPEWFWRRG